jgi:hypothetical protein
MMFLPTMEGNFYFTESGSVGYDAQNIGMVIQAGLVSYDLEGFCASIRENQNKGGVHVVKMTAHYTGDPPNKFVYWYYSYNPGLSKYLRNTETKYFYKTRPAKALKGWKEVTVEIIVSIRKAKRFNAFLTLMKTLTVCGCLTMTAIFLTGDQKSFILMPLQRLSGFLNVVMKNPLGIYGEYLIWRADPKTKIRTDIIEYHIIQMALMRIAAFLGAAHGGKAVDLFSLPLVIQKKDIEEVAYNTRPKSFRCVFVIMGIRNIPEVVENLGPDCV